MAHFKRTATAAWRGTGAEGSGSLSGPSGVLDNTPYSAAKRFQNEDGKAGTNPEELIAAAHAGCYIMALKFSTCLARVSRQQSSDARPPSTWKKGTAGWGFEKITFQLEAEVPGIERSKIPRVGRCRKRRLPGKQGAFSSTY
jgi:osmotically inducible protein OsmC